MQLESVVRSGDWLITANNKMYIVVGPTGTAEQPSYLLKDIELNTAITVPHLDPCQLLAAKGDECVIAAAPFCRYADQQVAYHREQQKGLGRRSAAYKEHESASTAWLKRKSEKRVFEDKWKVLKTTESTTFLESMTPPKQVMELPRHSTRGLRTVA